jgi:hypothetical protein
MKDENNNKNDNDNDENKPDLTKLTPWNSKDYPIVVNSIRYNHDFSLLSLGTSKGYKIFLTSTFKSARDDAEEIKNLDDISIAMVYFKSHLVFCLPSRFNKTFPTKDKELIIFDDQNLTQYASFKNKTEEILNFFLSRNILLIITISKVIILELYTLKIIEIIDNINTMNKLISFNFYDFVSYIKLSDKKNVYIKFYSSKNHKINSTIKKKVASTFEFMQVQSLSESGNMLCIVSIFGNKIHIYNIRDEKLKYCIYLGSSIQVIEKVFFSEKKANYFFILKNENQFNILKLPIDCIPHCVCDKYDDSKIGTEGKKDSIGGLFGYFKKFTNSKDIWESHAYGELNGKIEFIDFDRTTSKYIIYINKKGELYKYHFKKTPSGNITPFLNVQWM